MTDYMIPLNDKSAPLYEQIYRFIKEEIRKGRLGARTKLPSTRHLSESLGVSRSTVQLAYDQLVAEGYVEAKPYRGYFAAEIDVLLHMEPSVGKLPVHRALEFPSEKDAEPIESGMPDVDFSLRGIDLDHFPFNTWRKLSREILTMDNRELFSNGKPQGQRELREEICAYLQSARLVECRAEQIVIGAGSEYLLMLLDQILGKGAIAMETPTYRQAYRVLSALGHPILPVPMDRNGMDPERLQASGANIAYIMPSHQFPTGIVMPVRRRQELITWAAASPERFLIEDDYDSEFRYRGKPVPALYGSDLTGSVIYLGTFSKSVAPAIRVSYMVLPEPLLAVYRERCGFYTSTVSRVDQEILTRFLRDGYFERHLNRMRGVYRMKHDLLLDLLGPFRADFRIQGELAGLHLLLESRKNTSEEELIARAWEAGVRVYGLSEYLIPAATLPKECFPPESRTILLGYAGLSADQIRDGAERLKRAWGIW